MRPRRRGREGRPDRGFQAEGQAVPRPLPVHRVSAVMTPAALLAEHQRLILAVAMAPRGQKLRRQAELSAWVRSQLERETGRPASLMWWPIGKPLPPGASLARQQASHHSEYGQLIV